MVTGVKLWEETYYRTRVRSVFQWDFASGLWISYIFPSSSTLSRTRWLEWSGFGYFRGSEKSPADSSKSSPVKNRMSRYFSKWLLCPSPCTRVFFSDIQCEENSQMCVDLGSPTTALGFMEEGGGSAPGFPSFSVPVGLIWGTGVYLTTSLVS